MRVGGKGRPGEPWGRLVSGELWQRECLSVLVCKGHGWPAAVLSAFV